MYRIKLLTVVAVLLTALAQLSVAQNSTVSEEASNSNTTITTTETNSTASSGNTPSVDADPTQGNATTNNETSSANATASSVTNNNGTILANETSQNGNSTVTDEATTEGNTTSTGNNTSTTTKADGSSNTTVTSNDNTTATNTSNDDESVPTVSNSTSSTNTTGGGESQGSSNTSDTSDNIHHDSDSMTVFDVSEGCSHVLVECFTNHSSQASSFDYCEMYQQSVDCIAEPLANGDICNVSERARVETLFCSPDNLHLDVQDECKARLAQCLGPVLGTTYTEEGFKQGLCLALDIGGCLDVNNNGAVCATEEIEEIKEYAECSAGGLASSVILVAITFLMHKLM